MNAITPSFNTIMGQMAETSQRNIKPRGGVSLSTWWQKIPACFGKQIATAPCSATKWPHAAELKHLTHQHFCFTTKIQHESRVQSRFFISSSTSLSALFLFFSVKHQLIRMFATHLSDTLSFTSSNALIKETPRHIGNYCNLLSTVVLANLYFSSFCLKTKPRILSSPSVLWINRTGPYLTKRKSS